MIPKGREMMGIEEVRRKYGIEPSLLREYQAITGDAVVRTVLCSCCSLHLVDHVPPQDNIPGVAGLGPKAAVALVSHFKSVESMCRALGLEGIIHSGFLHLTHFLFIAIAAGLPPPPPELRGQGSAGPRGTGTGPNWKLIGEHLRKLQPPGFYEKEALPQLRLALQGMGMKAETVLSKLYLCGCANILLYRGLVTLKDDLDLREILIGSEGAAVDEVRKLLVERGSFVFPSDGSSGDEKSISSSDFRFVGEQPHVEPYLETIHPLLLKPLKMLREQYHRLDR